MSRQDVLARFLKDTANHKLTVVLDSGLHRHFRVQAPGTWVYGYDIVTWPGYLAITGDMGASVFTRLPDMLEFFRPDVSRRRELFINPPYWAEKLAANDGAALEFREDLFRSYVKERFDTYTDDRKDDEGAAPEWADELWSEIESRVILHVAEDTQSVESAILAMRDFEPDDERFDSFSFTDAWESARSLQDYTFHFYWRLYAIAFAVRAYDQAKAAQPTEKGVG